MENSQAIAPAQLAEIPSGSMEQNDLTLRQLAKIALEENHNEIAAAKDALVAKIRSDPFFYDPIIGDLIVRGVGEAVREQVKQQRGAIKSDNTSAGEPVDKKHARGSVVALANGIKAALLDMPLPGGKRLRVASKEDVLIAAGHYASAAKDARRKYLWYKSISEIVPSQGTVADALSEERAKELWDEAYQAAN